MTLAIMHFQECMGMVRSQKSTRGGRVAVGNTPYNSSDRTTFDGRCAWALLGYDNLSYGIYEHGAFPKIYVGVLEVAMGNAPYKIRDRTEWNGAC